MSAFAQVLKKTGVQELRFMLSPNLETTQGLRTFLQNNYSPLKEAYPKLPILVRESANQPNALIIARFRYGVEKGFDASNRQPEQIEKAFEALIKSQEHPTA